MGTLRNGRMAVSYQKGFVRAYENNERKQIRASIKFRQDSQLALKYSENGSYDTISVYFIKKKKRQRELKVTHPSDNLPLLVHADVMFTFFSFYSDVTPKRFCLNNKKSWKIKINLN